MEGQFAKYTVSMSDLIATCQDCHNTYDMDMVEADEKLRSGVPCLCPKCEAEAAKVEKS